MESITIKGIAEEDFTNYKKPSMVILFPKCSWKCDSDCGAQVCQNRALTELPDIQVDVDELVQRYLNNSVTEAVVLSGLEPLDSKDDVLKFIYTLRVKHACKDDIVIYTGYEPSEQTGFIKQLMGFADGNIIVKFGRYKPGGEKVFDDNLGVWLSNPEQKSIIFHHACEEEH